MGEALLEEHCTACHELDENDAHGPDDLAGWRSVVAAMVDEGAEYDDAVANQIAQYLAQKYPAPDEPVPTDTEGETGGETEPGVVGETEGETEAEEPEPEPTPTPEAVPEPEATPEPAAKPKKPKKKPKPKADKKNGRGLYMAKCKTCHGADGKGDTAFGRKLGVKSMTDLGSSKIRAAVVNGVPGTKMKSYKSKFTKQEVDDVVAFVKAL